MGRLKEFIRKKKFWFLGGLGILGVWGVLYLSYLPDGRLRLVFCDVGQGDGIYIDLPDGRDVLVDGGPNRKILQCLGKNMPFWDRRLEIVILTHPQADHLNGLIEVVKRYEVDWFVTSPIGNDTDGYKELARRIRERRVRVRNVYGGDKIRFEVRPRTRDFVSVLGMGSRFEVNTKLSGGVAFRVLWPSREFVFGRIGESREIGDIGVIRDENILGATTAHKDLNDFSIVMELKFGDFEALLTGDADEEIQDDILAVTELKDVEVFKIPHHGSKYGISDAFVTKAMPRFAVVSVGKNPWGHPTRQILEKLEVRGVKVLRTDKHGNIKFMTDGKQIWIKSDKN